MNSLEVSSNTSNLLNSTSIYQINTTIQEILSNFMIEQWNDQIFYQDYFNQCQPEECLITHVEQGNILHIITTMTGLIGGLTKVYRFAVPLLVKLVYYLIIRFKRRKLVNNKLAPLELTERDANLSV